MLLVRNSKGQNSGGESAVTKGLVGQVEGLVEKFPTTLYDKNAWFFSSWIHPTNTVKTLKKYVKHYATDEISGNMSNKCTFVSQNSP